MFIVKRIAFLGLVAALTSGAFPAISNGTLSQTNQPVSGTGDTALEQGCSVKPFPAETKFTYISAQKGRALSTVSLGGDDVVTTVADVFVPDGTTPLVVAISTKSPMIVRVDGAVDRIDNLLVLSETTGITGVSQEKVHFLQPECLETRRTRREDMKFETIITLAARTPDDMFSFKQLTRLDLETGSDSSGYALEGATSFGKRARATRLWLKFLMEYHGGLVDVDPQTVIAAGSPRYYDVLPTWAGVVKLIDEGALSIDLMGGFVREVEPDENGVAKIGNLSIIGEMGAEGIDVQIGSLTFQQEADGVWRARKPVRLRILEHITLPAALPRKEFLIFILRNGVPMPDNLKDEAQVVEGWR